MKEIKNALFLFGVLALLLGLMYPLAITGIAQVLFPEKANGSLIVVNGKIMGSEIIGQNFTSARYFHGRPSAVDYNAQTSGGSNLGPTNSRLIERVKERIEQIREENELPPDAVIPADLVLASGSGLDPYISVEAALIQVPRIARARGLDESVIRELIKKHQRKVFPGGPYIVSVLELNLALDGIGGENA